MRTTVDINDALLQAAKGQAARDRKPLKTVVEQALREFLSRQGRPGPDGPTIPVFHGRGVRPGVDLTDSASLEDVMNAEP